MAGQIGSPELLFGVWSVAGIITLFGALVNAEIAAMVPEAGGQYAFFYRMYGSFPAYLYGWAMFAVVKCGAIASLSFVFAESMGRFVALPELASPLATFTIHLPFIGDVAPLAEIGIKGVAAALIVVLTAINYLGVKFGSLVQNIFADAKSRRAAGHHAAGISGAGRWANNQFNDGQFNDPSARISAMGGIGGGHPRRLLGV
jgi:APA family basic amino acid/polyamine antiporter